MKVAVESIVSFTSSKRLGVRVGWVLGVDELSRQSACFMKNASTLIRVGRIPASQQHLIKFCSNHHDIVWRIPLVSRCFLVNGKIDGRCTSDSRGSIRGLFSSVVHSASLRGDILRNCCGRVLCSSIISFKEKPAHGPAHEMHEILRSERARPAAKSACLYLLMLVSKARDKYKQTLRAGQQPLQTQTQTYRLSFTSFTVGPNVSGNLLTKRRHFSLELSNFHHNDAHMG